MGVEEIFRTRREAVAQLNNLCLTVLCAGSSC